MEKKLVSGIKVTLLLIVSLLPLTFIFRPEATGSVWPVTDWSRTYGGTAYDEAVSVIQTGDGGYALAGYTQSFGAGNQEFWLVKTDSAGNKQWSKTYGGSSNEVAYSVVQTSDGGYAIAGYTWSFGAGSADFWLVKTDSSGNTQWNITYGGTNIDEAHSLVQTSDGGFAIAGDTQSFGAGNYDFWLVKTDSAGNKQWSKTYGGVNSDVAWSVVQTSDGGFAIAGFTTSYGAGGYDYWLVKTDSAGNTQWNKTYGGTNIDDGRSVVQTSDGGYAIAGWTTSFGAGSYDVWLVKTNSAGTIEWSKTYGGAGADKAYSVVQTSDGGYAIAGYTASYGAGSWDTWFVKTDSAGNTQWNKTYGGTSSDYSLSVIKTSDGGYALAGSTTSYGAGGYDFWLVKLTPATIYIRADGSVDPPTAPIERSGDLYTLTDNIYTSAMYGIVIQRNNIVLDGAGYTLQGIGPSSLRGIDLSFRSNVTIKNTKVKNFWFGFYLYYSTNNGISGNTIGENRIGVGVYYSSNYNGISRNSITANNAYGVIIQFSNHNSISGNNITANGYAGIWLYTSSNNTIARNNIMNNPSDGMGLVENASDNVVYHNNFIGNVRQVYLYRAGSNVWDDGYPSGGNYWSDYTGVDIYSGPYQNEAGSDGIGDTPYVIDVTNRDNYPLMEPWPAPKEATIIIGTTLQITVLDPAAAYDYYTWEVLNNIGEGLLKYKPGTTDLTYGIAENYTVSSGGFIYTFKLRSGMHFTDGEPLDAAAVKWSIDRVIRLGLDPSWLVSDYVEGVEVVDSLTVRFYLKKAVAYFPSLVAEAPYFPVSSRSYPENQTAEPTVGHYGPYKIRNWTRNVELVLEANPAYYGATPKSKYVIIKFFTNATMMRQALENGEIDIAWKALGATDITDLKKDLHFNVIETRNSFIRYIVLHCNMTPFDDVRLRRAVAAAINRTRIGIEAYRGLVDPLYSMVPAGIWSHIDAFKDEYGVRNLTLARELLTAAGYSEAEKLQFDLWYTPTHYGNTEADVAAIIRSDLEETSMIQVTLKSAEWPAYRANWQAGVMPIFLLGWFPDYIDPDDYLTPFVHSIQSGWLHAFYNNTVMDAILDEAMVEQNVTRRQTLYEDAQRLLAEEAPIIPFIQDRLYAVTKPNIKGIYLSLTSLLPYYTIYEVAHLTEYPWSMFRHDLLHTGYTESPAPRTNQIRWTYTAGGWVPSSPAVVNGRVYVASRDKKIYSFDALTGALTWNYTTGDIVYSSPAVADGKVYVGSYDRKVYCLDASTGTLVWTFTTGGTVFSSPAVVNGRVYVGSIDRKVYCLDASTGALIWNYTTGNQVQSSPAVVNGRVYVGSNDAKVYCLDALTGALIWNYTTGSRVFSSPAVVDGRVYVGSDDLEVYCLDASTGALIWNYHTYNFVRSSPAVVDGRVYVGSDDGNVHCLNASTGARKWTYATGGGVSSPAVADGRVYMGSMGDNKVYCLNSSTGALIWSYTTGGIVYSSPAVADGVVYVGSYDNRVYAFGNIVRAEDYPTIQEAINAATPGATIIIPPGVYSESLFIDKTLTILGQKGSGTEFAGGGYGTAFTYSGLGASGSILAQVVITNYAQGVLIDNSAQCKIYDNIMYAIKDSGIVLQGGSATDNQIYSNIIQNNNIALNLAESSTSNTVHSNTISLNNIGLNIRSGRNTIHSNSISQNQIGIKLSYSSENIIYWNNFINNVQALIETPFYANIWDDGYPSGGNYWSDYRDRYPYAWEFDDSGIWNTPYVIDEYNVDNYPLMHPVHEITVTRVTPHKTVVGQSYSLKIDITVTNQGRHTETLELTLYANTPEVTKLTNIILTSRHSTTLTFTLDTTNFAKGNYNIRVYATPVTGEVDTTDNNREGGTVMVTIPGDINGDKAVNALDLYALGKAYEATPNSPNWNLNANINNDDTVNNLDLEIISQNYGKNWL